MTMVATESSCTRMPPRLIDRASSGATGAVCTLFVNRSSYTRCNRKLRPKLATSSVAGVAVRIRENTPTSMSNDTMTPMIRAIGMATYQPNCHVKMME